MVSAQVIYRPSARTATGASQCWPVPGKESSVGGRSQETRQFRSRAHSFLQAGGFLQEGFSSTAAPNPVSHQPREMDSVKESCTWAGALGGAPLLVEVGSRGSKRSLMPRRVRWPDGGRGPPARPRRCPHSPSRPSVRSSSGPALPSSPSTATSSSSSSPEAPRPGEGWVSCGPLFFGRLTPIPPRPRGSGLPVLAAGRFLTSCLPHLAGSRWSSAFRPHAPRSR